MRLGKLYLGIAAALFLVELAIALFVRDAFVRPYIGDVLVVPLIHFGSAGFFELPPRRLGLLVFAFACMVEFAQYFHIVEVLGFQDSTVVSTVIGTGYNTWDLVAYAVGAVLSVWVHERLERASASAKPPG